MSDWVKGILKSLFDNGVGTEETAPLTRSPQFNYKYLKWKEAYAADHMLFLYNLVIENRKNAVYSRHITVMDNPASAGIHLDTSGLDPEWNWEFLMEHIKDVLLGEDYLVRKGEKTVNTESKRIKEKQEYYLKPKPNFETTDGIIRHRQAFGNIFLNLERVDDTPTLFKIQANYYAGFNYENPIPFEDLFV